MSRIAHLLQLGTLGIVLRHLGMDHIQGRMVRLQPGMVQPQPGIVLHLLETVLNICNQFLIKVRK